MITIADGALRLTLNGASLLSSAVLTPSLTTTRIRAALLPGRSQRLAVLVPHLNFPLPVAGWIVRKFSEILKRSGYRVPGRAAP